MDDCDPNLNSSKENKFELVGTESPRPNVEDDDHRVETVDVFNVIQQQKPTLNLVSNQNLNACRLSNENTNLKGFLGGRRGKRKNMENKEIDEVVGDDATGSLGKKIRINERLS